MRNEIPAIVISLLALSVAVYNPICSLALKKMLPLQHIQLMLYLVFILYSGVNMLCRHLESTFIYSKGQSSSFVLYYIAGTVFFLFLSFLNTGFWLFPLITSIPRVICFLCISSFYKFTLLIFLLQFDFSYESNFCAWLESSSEQCKTLLFLIFVLSI